MLITNDPWLSAGHFFDITVMVPAFHKGKLVGFFGSTIHHTDIGGYGVGAGARDVHEEGLWIPMLKLYERGEPNKVLHEIIRRNVRTPNEVFGDLAAQVSSGKLAGKRLSALLDRQGYDDIETLSDEIIARSEDRDARVDPQAQARHLSRREPFDVPGGDIITLKTAVTVDAGQRRDHHRLRRQLGPEPLRHQRGDELHPRLLDLRDPLLPQSRAAEQFRQPRADQGRRRRKAASSTASIRRR